MPSFTRIQLEDYLSKLDVKAEAVLDVGGSQKPVKKRVASWDVKEYQIMDLEVPHEGETPDIILDLDNIEAKAEGVIGKFDMLFCLEVFEYVTNPNLVARRLAAFLKQGGIAYISFTFIYPHHNPVGKDYLRYTRWGAEKILQDAGFELVECTPRIAREPLILYDWFDAEGLKMSKDYRGHNEVGYIYKVKKI